MAGSIRANSEIVFSQMFSSEAIGYSLIRTWSSLLFSSSLVFLASEALGSFRNIAHDVSIGMLAVTFFAFALIVPFKGIANGKRLRIASLWITEAGTVLIIASALVGNAPFACIAVGAILTGVGSGALSLLWGAEYSTLSPEKAMLSTIGAFLVASVLTLALSAASIITIGISAIVLPFASAAMLSHDIPTEEQLQRQDKARGLIKPSTVLRPPLFIALVSIVLGGINEFCNTSLLGIGASSPELRFIAFLTFAIAASLVVRFHGPLSATMLLKASIIIPAVYLLLLPFLSVDHVALALISSIGVATLRITVWAYIAHTSGSSPISPFVLFGFGMGAHYLGMSAGDLFARRLLAQGAAADTVNMLFAFSAVMFFLLIGAYAIGAKPLSHHPESVHPSNSGPRKFYSKLESIAAYYGLTNREAELLKYLAKGYSSKSIQSTLFISASTVSAHSGSIYRKMGVHSKEEVAEIVRNWTEESDDPLEES